MSIPHVDPHTHIPHAFSLLKVQLNVTWIGPRGPPVYLTYAWSDYPHAMPFISADVFRLPAGPFNVSIVV